ncbi:histidine phosphatase family protein [Candidatus Dojkabacteria bacterium]|nr:histidine phosphatase family protein [Candidatus Dojkabacteria bacterium]
MKVFFMRHGEGVDDVEKRYGGWGDLPLSEKGRKQAKDSVEKVEKLDIDLVLSSPLKRAMETAEILAKGKNLKAKRWLYLKERNTYGLMCGEKEEDMKKEYPELYDAYEDGGWVAGSERYEDLVKRLKEMMKKIQAFKAERILAVTHGKVLAAIVKEFLGKELDKKEDCCILGLEVDGDKVELISAYGLSFK